MRDETYTITRNKITATIQFKVCVRPSVANHQAGEFQSTKYRNTSICARSLISKSSRTNKINQNDHFYDENSLIIITLNQLNDYSLMLLNLIFVMFRRLTWIRTRYDFPSKKTLKATKKNKHVYTFDHLVTNDIGSRSPYESWS